MIELSGWHVFSDENKRVIDFNGLQTIADMRNAVMAQEFTETSIFSKFIKDTHHIRDIINWPLLSVMRPVKPLLIF